MYLGGEERLNFNYLDLCTPCSRLDTHGRRSSFTTSGYNASNKGNKFRAYSSFYP